MRRRSGTNFEEVNHRDFNSNTLSKGDQTDLANNFRKTEQRNGGISFYDLVNILRSKSCSTQIADTTSPRSVKVGSTRSWRSKRSRLSTSLCSSGVPPCSRRRRRSWAAKTKRRAASTVRIS